MTQTPPRDCTLIESFESKLYRRQIGSIYCLSSLVDVGLQSLIVAIVDIVGGGGGVVDCSGGGILYCILPVCVRFGLKYTR